MRQQSSLARLLASAAVAAILAVGLGGCQTMSDITGSVTSKAGASPDADLRRAVAILISSGSDWTDRTKRLAARTPDLNIFSQAFVLRDDAGWHITDAGRAFLVSVERPVQMAVDNEQAPELVRVGRQLGSSPALSQSRCDLDAKAASSVHDQPASRVTGSVHGSER